jgi:hypothetical protein
MAKLFQREIITEEEEKFKKEYPMIYEALSNMQARIEKIERDIEFMLGTTGCPVPDWGAK